MKNLTKISTAIKLASAVTMALEFSSFNYDDYVTAEAQAGLDDQCKSMFGLESRVVFNTLCAGDVPSFNDLQRDITQFYAVDDIKLLNEIKWFMERSLPKDEFDRIFASIHGHKVMYDAAYQEYIYITEYFDREHSEMRTAGVHLREIDKYATNEAIEFDHKLYKLARFHEMPAVHAILMDVRKSVKEWQRDNIEV